MDEVGSKVEYMLTTVDNPWNPFTHFKEWFAFDVVSGYNTAAFLDRIVITSDELSDADQAQAIQVAIDEILKENVLGLYRRIARPTMVSESSGLG